MKAPRNKVSHRHRIKVWGWAWRRSREKGIIIHSINRYWVNFSFRPEYFAGPEAIAVEPGFKYPQDPKPYILNNSYKENQ